MQVFDHPDGVGEHAGEEGPMGSPEHEQLGGRLPLLGPGSLLSAQRQLYDHLLSTKLRWAEETKFQGALADGRMIGPFNVFLRTPEMSRAFNDWVDAEGPTPLSPRRSGR